MITAAYLYADNEANKRFIGKQEDRISALKNENKELYGKLFTKNGMTPVGYQKPQREPKSDPTPTPSVVTRQQLHQRTLDREDKYADIAVEAAKIINP